MTIATAPHCPACAAPLPPIDRQEIVTCDSCGTDCNADFQPAPVDPPRSPPLSATREWSADSDDPTDWGPGAYVHALLTAPTPEKRLNLARMHCGHLHGDEALRWAPAIGEGVIRAEQSGEHELAAELAFKLYHAGVGHREYPYHFRDEQRNPDWPLAAADLAMDRDIENKSAWVFLSVARQILDQQPASRAGLIALASAGAPALQTFLEVATQANARADTALADEALACVKTLLVRTVDDHRWGVLFDSAAHLLPRLTGRAQQTVIDSLAEVSDAHVWLWGPDWAIGDHLKVYPEDWRGPADALTVLLTYVDDLLHEHPELGSRFLAAIVKASDKRYSKSEDWKTAMQAVASPEGQDACIAAYVEIFGPIPQRLRESRHPRDEGFDYEDAEELIAPTDAPRGIKPARARNGQAPCPACGRALRLRDDTGGSVSLITTCDHCGQRSRVAREARTIRKALDPASLDLHTWAPERLVRTMIETPDEALRLTIADELASATTDGKRFVALAPALVAYMMAEAIPEEVEHKLQHGFESMLRFRDPAFLEALFTAIREQAFEEEGSDRLLLALEAAGPPAGPLLLDLVDKVTASVDGWGKYTQRAKQVAWHVMHQWFADDPAAATEFTLERMQDAGAALAEELPVLLGSCVFDRENAPLDDVHKRLVAFIDDHIATDQSTGDRITWIKGMQAYAPDLHTPNYSWTADDIAAAEKRLGLKWAQGGELDTSKILADVVCLPASRVTVRQLSTLISQMESFWGPAPTGGNLIARLKLATTVRHEATRVMILSLLRTRPADLTPEGEAIAQELLAAMPAGEHTTPWTAFVAQCLADPQHADRTAQRVYARADGARMLAVARQWRQQGAIGVLVGMLLRWPRLTWHRMTRR